jgi:hypothetical protein
VERVVAVFALAIPFACGQLDLDSRSPPSPLGSLRDASSGQEGEVSDATAVGAPSGVGEAGLDGGPNVPGAEEAGLDGGPNVPGAEEAGLDGGPNVPGAEEAGLDGGPNAPGAEEAGLDSGPDAPSAEAEAGPVSDPNWSLVGHPFDSPVVGSDTDGSPLFACRGTYQGSLQVGRTRTDWQYCDIGFNGSEVALQAYESLVGGWIDETNGDVPSNALPFGNDGTGGPTLYSCRAFLSGNGYQLGKVRPGFGGCFIPYNTSEVSISPYQVLTSALPLVTQTMSSAAPPSAALVGGYDTDNEPLYPCQAFLDGVGYVPGKTRPSWNNCDVGYSGTENHMLNYNVLVPQFKTPGTVYQAGTDSDGSPLGICRGSYSSSDSSSSEQVGKYLTDGTCSFGVGGVVGGMVVSLTSGFQVLAF